MTERLSSTASPSEHDVSTRRFLAKDPRTVERVMKLAARVVGFHGYAIPAEERRDVSQEVVLQVWRCLTENRSDNPGHLGALVRAVAYRRCIDWVRRRRSMTNIESGQPGLSPGPESRMLEAERHRLASDALSRLGEGCRQLIRMHAMENRTYREISVQLGRTEGALRVQMSVCLKKAREILGRASEDWIVLRGRSGKT